MGVCCGVVATVVVVSVVGGVLHALAGKWSLIVLSLFGLGCPGSMSMSLSGCCPIKYLLGFLICCLPCCDILRVANTSILLFLYIQNFATYILLRLFTLLPLGTVGPVLDRRSCFCWVLC